MQPVIQLLIDQPEQTVVTATRRLSRRLLHEYNQHQLASGLTAWPTPDILSWSAWVQRQWQAYALQAAESHVVLTTAQSLQLWQSIIEADSDKLINAQSTARKAQAAHQQIIDYTLDLQNDTNRQWFVYDVDASRWLDWHLQYSQTLVRNNWLDPVTTTQILIRQTIENEVAIERPLCFIGFDELTPLQQQLQAWLVANNLWLDAPGEADQPGTASTLAIDDPLSEILQAATWARQQFENHWQEGDAPIGIIVPKLEQRRHQFERTFREVFYPQDDLQTLAERPLHTQGIREDAVFNISLGQSLGQEPVIATVLKVLQLCRRSFAYEDFSQVLRSPFIRDAQEQRATRSALDNYLRQKTSADSSLYALLNSLSDNEDSDIRQLLSDLTALQEGWIGKASAQVWVDRFQQCLKLFGLLKTDTGDESGYPSGYEYQVMQSVDELWFEFSRLELVQPPMSLEQALTALTQMVNSQIFQSGAAELPVQILGVIEAAGIEFSSLWVTGMTEQNWPPPANPNPFIPLRLQRQHGMPHCSPQREFEYASQQTQRMLQAAQEIVFSYPLRDGEEEFVPSPLVTAFPPREAIAITEQAVEAPAMETLLDEQGPTVDVANYHAGSAALKDQSQCPFRAFVVHRLKSRLPEEPQPGNDPRLRGNLVHRVMELLWQQWQSSDQLAALSEEELHAVVRETIEQVMQSQWLGSNRDYEAKRLFNLTIEWLQQEKQRQPFEVKALEQETPAEINQLKLRLYIDRIDELADGSSCVIDYKTGEARSNAWLGERPDEPQLPLYALVQPDDVHAVAFANIRSGECQYVGVTSDQALMGVDEKALKDVRQIPISDKRSLLKNYESWQGMLEEWQQTINQLADHHVQGDARVDPKKYPQTCSYCDVNAVCRLFDWQEDEEGEAV